MTTDLNYIDGVFYDYMRSVLDTNGYPSVQIYKSKEADDVVIPFVTFSYVTLPLPFNQVTYPKNATFKTHSRGILSVLIVGDDNGSNKTLAQSVGTLLFSRFDNTRSDVDKIGNSQITIGLNAEYNDNTQSYEVAFQTSVIVINTAP